MPSTVPRAGPTPSWWSWAIPAQTAALHGALPRTDVLFDDVLHVPLVVAGPALGQPGVPTSAVVESIDVYPTLLALCGLPPVPGLEGKSLVPLLEDPKAPLKRAAFSAAAREAGEIGRSARTSRYRYNEWPDGSEELYDHDEDPRELKNVVRVPSQAAVREEMRRLIGSRFEAPAPAKPPARPAGAAKLNVLFIILDDMGPQIGALGYPVSTPNIDRLAKRGRLFDHAYAQVAICSPSRSSLLTGWRPERTDVWNNLTPAGSALRGCDAPPGALPQPGLLHRSSGQGLRNHVRPGRPLGFRRRGAAALGRARAGKRPGRGQRPLELVAGHEQRRRAGAGRSPGPPGRASHGSTQGPTVLPGRGLWQAPRPMGGPEEVLRPLSAGEHRAPRRARGPARGRSRHRGEEPPPGKAGRHASRPRARRHEPRPPLPPRGHRRLLRLRQLRRCAGGRASRARSVA